MTHLNGTTVTEIVIEIVVTSSYRLILSHQKYGRRLFLGLMLFRSSRRFNKPGILARVVVVIVIYVYSPTQLKGFA